MIIFDSKNKIFNLCNENFSYIFCINKLGYLIHLYNGKKIGNIGIERTNERNFNDVLIQTDDQVEENNEQHQYANTNNFAHYEFNRPNWDNIPSRIINSL